LKIILTEQQLQILTEALGVPDEILNAAEKLYEIILENLKTIEDKEEEYDFSGSLDVEIGKLYAMAKDDENMNESIQNWDLHQKLMEKKYGKRKISTTYKYKNFK
jgi:hypothetical protein